MQRFYEEYFVMPRFGEKFVLIELYRNGVFVAVGASKYKVNANEGTSTQATGVDTDPFVVAERLIDACPWL